MLDYQKYKILFFGSSEFAVPVLELLLKNNWNVVAVVTQPDRPKGRNKTLSPTPVKTVARKNKIKIMDHESLKTPEARKAIMGAGADLAVVVSYGQLIPLSIFNAARLGFINIHPSLLPKYRGPAPIQYALLNGEIKTGISLILLDSEMDHGPILDQKVVPVRQEDDYTTLHNRLSDSAAEFLQETMPKFIRGDLKPKPQNDREATYTKILTKEDGRINWKNTAVAIVQKIKAFSPWPGTWTTLNNERIKILEAGVVDLSLVIQPGQIRATPKLFYVGCGNKTILNILRLQPEGRKDMTAESFLRGRQNLQGAFFE